MYVIEDAGTEERVRICRVYMDDLHGQRNVGDDVCRKGKDTHVRGIEE